MTVQYVMMPVELPQDFSTKYVMVHHNGARFEDAWAEMIAEYGVPVTSTNDLEASIVRIQDMHGEPALVFPGTPKTQVSILLSHLASHILHHPNAVEAILKAVAKWKLLKATGHT